MKKWIIAAFMCLGAASASAQWVDVTDPEELRDMFSGRESIVTTSDGQPWSSSVNRPDGHGTSTSVRGNLHWARDWVVKGSQVCVQDHLQGWEGIWACRRFQRHATIKGKYRSILVGEPDDFKTPWPMQKILNIEVRPAPGYRQTG